ncbi:MAG: hypothetical protein HRU19_03310 [Pseudobacteriovorax sp.]|nr:hypothetical protein [Pseudobacteriovorax sp.]
MKKIHYPKGWAPIGEWLLNLQIDNEYRPDELERKISEMTRLVKGCVRKINRQGEMHQVFHKRIIADVLVKDGVMEEFGEEHDIPDLARVGGNNV